MSIKTTHIVTRDFAIKAIQQELEECTDEQLSNILEEVIHNGFYNFSIVSDVEFQENLENMYPSPYLNNLDYLPECNNAW